MLKGKAEGSQSELRWQGRASLAIRVRVLIGSERDGRSARGFVDVLAAPPGRRERMGEEATKGAGKKGGKK